MIHLQKLCWLVLVTTLAGTTTKGEEVPVAPPREITIEALPDVMRFNLETLSVEPGERILLTLINPDRMQHNWVLCKMGNDTAMQVARLAWALGAEATRRNYVPNSELVLASSAIVNPGKSTQIEFTAPTEKGAYPYVCTLPGHAFTMRGVLYVGTEPAGSKERTQASKDFPADGVERSKMAKRRFLPYQEIGSVFRGTLFIPDTQLPPVPRGIAVRVGHHGEGGVLYDPDLMRCAAGWIGEFIKPSRREDEANENRHETGGSPMFVTSPDPGWADPETGSLSDPRTPRFGPLPKPWSRLQGVYHSGHRTVLAYQVGDRKILESPWIENAEGHMVLTRTLQIAPSKQASTVVLCSAPKAYDFMKREAESVKIYMMGDYSADALTVSLAGDLENCEAKFSDLARIILTIPPSEKTLQIKVFITQMYNHEIAVLGRLTRDTKIDNLEQWTHGGEPRWPEIIHTRGEVSDHESHSDAAYVVDTLTLPYDNPWNAMMYTSGHDFFSNGDAAISTSHGDVWVVSGIDDKLQDLKWKRFASGLSSPLGLKIVNDVIHVTCHDQIARLHDMNQDGEADYIENFNSTLQVSRAHHRFTASLETDSKGNFYFTKCSEEGETEQGGTMVRLSPDGEEFEIFATGLRNPNGMGIGPNDLITFGKQQGGWVPSSGIAIVRQGGFQGYMPSHHRSSPPTEFDPPLCWIPHGVDNSSGGQAWAPADDCRWGPLAGQLLHFSYGKCSMFVVPFQKIGNTYQGAVVPLPGVAFQSSGMRGRFRKNDGQLYVCGLRGWQTSAARSGAFHRVRYTGKPLRIATGYEVTPEGIRVTFDQALDSVAAVDLDSYQVQQWNYRWTDNYGSPDYSVLHPDQKGRDTLNIQKAELSDDQKSVLLHIPDLQPVDQIHIKIKALDANKSPLETELFGTIHQIPGRI